MKDPRLPSHPFPTSKPAEAQGSALSELHVLPFQGPEGGTNPGMEM